MSSNINPYNIDSTFPVAGQDNDSQGFRSNFTNIKNSLVFAKSEIDDLQLKGIFKANIVGTTLDNDMAGTQIKNATMLGFREVVKNHGSLSGSTNISFADGHYHIVNVFGNLDITGINEWPSVSSGTAARLRLAVTTTVTGATVTFPSSVSIGLNTISGAAGQTITFTTIGTYVFELSSSDGGTTIIINDLSRSRNSVPDNLVVSGNVLATGSITASSIIGPYNPTASTISIIGSITGNTITANSGITGTLVTPIQSSITQVGNLTSLTVVGNVTAGNAEVIGTTLLDGDTTLTQAVNTPATLVTANTTVALASNVHTVIIDPGTAITSANIIMPSAPANGQRVTIGFGNTVTLVNHTSNGGQTLNGSLTTGNASTFGTWVYHATNTTWYRIS